MHIKICKDIYKSIFNDSSNISFFNVKIILINIYSMPFLQKDYNKTLLYYTVKLFYLEQ